MPVPEGFVVEKPRVRPAAMPEGFILESDYNAPPAPVTAFDTEMIGRQAAPEVAPLTERFAATPSTSPQRRSIPGQADSFDEPWEFQGSIQDKGDTQSVLGISTPDQRESATETRAAVTGAKNAIITIPASLAAGVERGAGASQVALGFAPEEEVTLEWDPNSGGYVETVKNPTFFKSDTGLIQSGLDKMAESEMVQAQIEKERPATGTIGKAIRSGATMIGNMLPNVPLMAIPGIGTDLGLISMAKASGADAIKKGKELGLSDSEIVDYQNKVIAPEYAGERANIGILLSTISGKNPLIRQALKMAGSEYVSEAGTSHMQFAADKAYEKPGLTQQERDAIYKNVVTGKAFKNDKKLLDEYVNMQKDTATSVLGMTGLATAGGKAYRGIVNAATRQEPVAAPDQESAAAPDLDFASNTQPFDQTRFDFELGLMKNKNTSKTAVLVPQAANMNATQVKGLATKNGFMALKVGDEYYIYDPKQINGSTLRGQVAAGKNGQALGYGTDAVPENGVPYAVDINGHGTLDPAEMLALRDAGQLGFAGMATDRNMAIEKIREMGRDDAEIRGIEDGDLSEVRQEAGTAEEVSPVRGEDVAVPIPADVPGAQTVSGVVPEEGAAPAIDQGELTNDQIQEMRGREEEVELPEETAPAQDQRKDYGRREQIQALIDAGDVEGAHRLIYEDPLTGLLNSRAWSEVEPTLDGSKTVASMDTAGVKWINDTFGHDAGDMLLKTVGDVIREHGVEAYRKGGDEVAGIFDSPAQADEVLARAQDALAKKVIAVTTPDGKVYQYTGWRLDYGTGTDFKSADQQLYDKREQARTAGLRSERGAKPYGLAETVSTGVEDSGQVTEGTVAPEGQAGRTAEGVSGEAGGVEGGKEGVAETESYASTGTYADIPGQDIPPQDIPGTDAPGSTREPMGDTPGTNAPSVKVMGLRQIVKLAKQVMGKNPQVVRSIRKKEAIRGMFTADGKGDIKVRADLMQTPGQMEKTLAHEVGHLGDYSPDQTMARGNILGRIASLNNYTKSLLEEYPGSPNKILTDADRARIRREAERQIKAEEQKSDKTIIEEITWEEPIFEEVGLTPEMVLSIWNDVTSRDKYPELYKAVAGMTPSQKKAAIMQAMKGMVPPELSHIGAGKQVGTRTVTEKREVVFPGRKATPAEKAARYKKLLQEEIFKRRLYEKEVITKELQDLSYAWRPLPANPSVAYLKYRNKSTELYADAISALLNSPGFMAEKAPTFTKAFFAYMERKPQFKRAFDDIQAELNMPKEEQGRRLLEETEQMYQEHQAEINRLAAIPEETEGLVDGFRRTMLDENWSFNKVARKIGDEQGKHAMKLVADLAYLSSETKGLLMDFQQEILAPLEAAGAGLQELGVYMELNNILSEEYNPKAASQGKTYEDAQLGLATAVREWGGEKFDAVAKAQEKFFRWYRDNVLQHPGAELVLGKKRQARYIENTGYARKNVTKYLDDNFGGGALGRLGFHEKIGSFEEQGNPAQSTLMQALGMAKTFSIAQAKDAIATTLDTAGEIIPAKMVFDKGKNRMVPLPPKDKFHDIFSVARNGKMEYYYADKGIVRMFEYDPVPASNMARLFSSVAAPFRAAFTSMNPLFIVKNPFRDIQGTFKLNKEIGFSDIPSLLKAYFSTFKEIRDYAVNGKASPLVKELLLQKAIPVGRNWSTRDMEVADEILRLVNEFNLNNMPSAKAKHAYDRIKQLFGVLEKNGMTLEVWGKAAGYKWLKENTELTQDELTTRTRDFIGTPNYKARGSLAWLTNNTMPFSTVRMSGLRAATRSFKDAPFTFLYKAAMTSMLNKVILGLAAAGVLGVTEDQRRKFKAAVDRIPSPHKNNSLVVFSPRLTDNGLAEYLTIPEDPTGQAIGQLTASLMSGKLTGKNSALNTLFQQLPWNPTSLYPLFEGTALIANYYARGVNTLDDFRGENYLSDDAMKAGGKHAAKEIGEGLYSISGLSPFLGRIEKDTDATKKKTEFEKALGVLPLSMLGAFYKRSDAGLKEPMREAREKAEKGEATDRIKARAAAAKLFKKEELTEADKQALAKKPDLVKNMMEHKTLVEQGLYLPDALNRAGSKNQRRQIIDVD